MTRAVMLVSLLALAAAGCSKSSIRTAEGIVCSVTEDDDPYRFCDTADADLLCANTFFVGTQKTPAWVCRVGCMDANDCTPPGDVCCAGSTAGDTLGYERVCVPEGLCQTDPAPLTRINQPPSSRADAGPRPDAATSLAVSLGDYCSANASDRPFRNCTPVSEPLVCINTYEMNQTPQWLCREACSQPADCSDPAMVCCEGPIVFNNTGFARGCVPPDLCMTDPSMPKPAVDAAVD